MKINYPYLPVGKTIEYVPENDGFMRAAIRTRNEHSTDLNHPTGAVVVLDGKIIGWAANQSALRNKKLLELHKKGWCVRKLLKIPSGQRYWLCPGCASFRHHAEARAMKDALTRAPSLTGADMYLYGHWWCCKPCWSMMIKVGIKNVYLAENATDLFK